MRNILKYSMILVIFLIAANGFCQETQKDRLVAQFSDPNKPGLVEIGLINGGITVTGYNGKDVIAEAAVRSRNISDDDVDDDDEVNKKAKGMKRIFIASTGLSIEEEDNIMEISVTSWRRTIDLTIKVPNKTNLKLSCVNAGDIIVKNVEGEIDVNNINGKVSLYDVSGSVLAHALNKDLTVIFNRIDKDKAMSFSTLNGDIDVLLPTNLKADVKLNSDNGEIFSDFDIKLKKSLPKKVVGKNGRNEDGKFKIEIENVVYGTINGGGPEFVFKSFNGDIYIRNKK